MGKRAFRVAVTGGAGSGKSTVCEMLKESGMRVYDADRFARDAVEVGTPAYRKIVDHFGREILNSDGSLNRRLLRDIITGDKDAKEALEKIVHPEITRMMLDKLEQAAETNEIVAMEVPLLYELGLGILFDVVVMVLSEENSRIERLKKRDGIDEDRAAALIGLQMPDSKKAERADFVVSNSGSRHRLARNVEKLRLELFNSAKKR